MSTIPPPDYYAYLVRLWRATPDGSWRVSIQDAHSETKLGFDSLDGLHAFLQTQMGQPPMTPPPTLADIGEIPLLP